jgi:hypothetical protein
MIGGLHSLKIGVPLTDFSGVLRGSPDYQGDANPLLGEDSD